MIESITKKNKIVMMVRSSSSKKSNDKNERLRSIV